MIAEALAKFLNTQTSITDLLAKYEFDTGTPAPAIFTTDTIPDNAEYPAIIIRNSGGSSFGMRSTKGADVNATIQIYDDRTRDLSNLRKISRLVYFAVSRSELDPDGACSFRVVCSPPAAFSDEVGFPGQQILVSSLVFEGV